MSDVFFLGLTDSMIARELDRYQNPEPAGDCFEDIDIPALDCMWCKQKECQCVGAKCEVCGKGIVRSAKQRCITEFHGLEIVNKVYHMDCYQQKSQEAA